MIKELLRTSLCSAYLNSHSPCPHGFCSLRGDPDLYIIVKCAELNEQGAMREQNGEGERKIHLNTVVREDHLKKLPRKLRSEA